MMKNLRVYESAESDPYLNMATEKYLTLHAAPEECILYLWQNANTVVIGRNQDCFAECRVAVLEADGGHLARRLSGGGAVYHDINNLNFTFALNRAEYDVARQLSVIAGAVRSFGIEAEVSGRNDLLTGGAKFSGNAFWCFGENYYHHGTILIDTDAEMMARYLSVPEDKLKAKGIASVRSRVVNLSRLCPRINVTEMKGRLRESFSGVYGLPVTEYIIPDSALPEIEGYRRELSAPEWIYGRNPEFTHRFSSRFGWGGVTFCFNVAKGVVRDCEVWSDSLDPEYIASLPALLRGCGYDCAGLCAALSPVADSPETADIAALFAAQIR